MFEKTIDEGFGVESGIDGEGGGDKNASEFSKLGMGDVGIEFPGETLVARFGECVAFGLQRFEDRVEFFAVCCVPDIVTIRGHHWWLKCPYPDCKQHFMRIKMQVKAAATHSMPRPLPKDHPDPLFDGAGGMETGIAVDAEEGVVDLWGGMDRGDEDLQVLPHLFDEGFGGGEDVAKVALFVVLKPLFVVVSDDVMQEGDRLGWEACEGHDYRNSADPTRTIFEPDLIASS